MPQGIADRGIAPLAGGPGYIGGSMTRPAGSPRFWRRANILALIAIFLALEVALVAIGRRIGPD